MREEEFFQSFQDALTGEVSESVIQENIRYYKNYIYEEHQRGNSVDEILDKLGNPRLLAKTIINTSANNSYNYRDSYTDYDTGSQNFEDAKDHRSIKQKIKELQIPSWLRKIISMIIVIAVIVLAFALISYLAPFILFIVCIGIVIKIVRNISEGS